MDEKLPFQENNDAVCNTAAQMHENRENNLFDYEHVSLKYQSYPANNWKYPFGIRQDLKEVVLRVLGIEIIVEATGACEITKRKRGKKRRREERRKPKGELWGISKCKRLEKEKKTRNKVGQEMARCCISRIQDREFHKRGNTVVNCVI